MKKYSKIKLDLDQYNFANLFNIIDLNEKSYFNLCKTIYFNYVDRNNYNNYKIVEGDSWTGISYKFYDTIKLWWLICKFNDIKNPFEELVPGKVIKILKSEYINNILNTIKIQ